jgi:hypothetical protein
VGAGRLKALGKMPWHGGQKALQEAGDQGFEIVGLTVGQTAVGGKEPVSITRRKACDA